METVKVPISALKQKYVDAPGRLSAGELETLKATLIEAGTADGLRKVGEFRVDVGVDFGKDGPMVLTRVLATFCPEELLK